MLSIPAVAPDPVHSLNGLRALLDASAAGVFLPASKGTDDLRKVNQLLMDSEARALSEAPGDVALARPIPGPAGQGDAEAERADRSLLDTSAAAFQSPFRGPAPALVS
jgi:hypothetical protein